MHHLYHQVGHITGLRQVRTSLDGHALLATQQLTYGQAQVGRLQGHAHIVHRDTRTIHAQRVNLHQHRSVRTTEGDHITGTGHALDIGLDAVCHTLQVKSTHLGRTAMQGE